MNDLQSCYLADLIHFLSYEEVNIVLLASHSPLTLIRVALEKEKKTFVQNNFTP